MIQVQIDSSKRELNYNILDCPPQLLSQSDVDKTRERNQWLVPGVILVLWSVITPIIAYFYGFLGFLCCLCAAPFIAAVWNDRVTPRRTPTDHLSDSENGRRLLKRVTELLETREQLLKNEPPRRSAAHEVVIGVNERRLHWESAWRMHVEGEWLLNKAQADIVGKLVANSDDPTIH